MKTIRSSEKALERIRSSGSFPTPEHRLPGSGAKSGSVRWLSGGPVAEHDDEPAFRLRHERSRTAEIALSESDDENSGPFRAGAGSRAAGLLAEDKLRELNAAGLEALSTGNRARAKQLLEDALSAAKRGDIANAGLSAATYANYGVMLLDARNDSERAVDVLADAVVRISKVPPNSQSMDLEHSLTYMRTILASILEQGASQDIRLEAISRFAAGTQLERERKGFECLEHLRIANDLSRTCMGLNNPVYKAISGVFDRAKKNYAAGASTFQSKKTKSNAIRTGKNGSDTKDGDSDQDDVLGGRGKDVLFEEGLSNDVWSALKGAGKAKPKGMRVTVGTAAKASLANRNLQSREGGRGISRGGKRESTPETNIFEPAAGKKSSFLASLLGDDTKATTPQMPSISQKPGSQSTTNQAGRKKSPSSTVKSTVSVSESVYARRDTSESVQSRNEVLMKKLTASGTQHQPISSSPAGRGGLKEIEVPAPGPRKGGLKEISVPVPETWKRDLKEISVPVPGPRNRLNGRVKTPPRDEASSKTPNAVYDSKSSQEMPKDHSPGASEVASDESMAQYHLSGGGEISTPVTAGESSIDDLIGELSLGNDSGMQQNQCFPAAQHVQEDEDDAAPKFITIAHREKEREGQKNTAAADSAFALAREKLRAGDIVAAKEAISSVDEHWLEGRKDKKNEMTALKGDVAAAVAKERLEAGDLAAAREAMVSSGKEWLAAGVDKTSELAVLAAKLAMGLAREKIGADDVAGAREALVVAVAEWKKAGENRTNEVAQLEAEIGAVAVKLGRIDDAAEMYRSALEVAEKNGDVQSQLLARTKLANACKMLGRMDEAIDIHTKGLKLAQAHGDNAAQVAAYEGLGEAYQAVGRAEEALSVFTKSLELTAAVWNVAGQGRAQHGMGVAMAALGRHTDALSMILKAVENSENTGDVEGIRATSKSLGDVYAALGNHHEAVNALKKAMQMAERSGDTSLQSSSLEALGCALTALGRHQELEDGVRTFATLQHYDEAVQMHSKALHLAEQTPHLPLQISSSVGLANAYEAMGRHQEAIEIFSKALGIAGDVGDEAGQARALDGLGRALRLEGKYQEAAEMHSKSLKVAELQGDVSLQALALMGLANALKSQGLYKEAVEMREKAKQKSLQARTALNPSQEKEWNDSIASSLLIQCNFRVHLARKMMSSAQNRVYGKNIVVLQAAIRRHLSRSKYAVQLKRKRALLKVECTVLIQSKFRRALANTRWVKTIHWWLVVCAHIRTVSGVSYEAKRNAAIILQAAERSRQQSIEGENVISLALKQMAEEELRRREEEERRQEEERLERERQEQQAMTCRVQAFVRRYEPRARHRTIIAARILQAVLRKKRAQGSFAKLRATSTLSCHAQAALCRREYHRHRTVVAARVLQAELRKERAQRSFSKLKAASTLSCHAHAALRRREYVKTSAALLIQSHLRHLLDRLKWVTMDGAALVKTPAEMDILDRMREEERSAAIRCIQSKIRRLLQRRIGSKKMMVAKKTSLCRLLQAACRRQSSRRMYDRLLAAVTLQARNRAVLMREHHRKCLASRKLQAALRRGVAINKRTVRDNATIALSQFFKAALARQNHARRHVASVRLQANLRRLLGQHEGATRMQQYGLQSSCQALQAACRCSISRELFRKYLAVLVIQAILRRNDAKHRSQVGQQALQTVKRFFQRVALHQKYCQKQAAIKELQAVFRRSLGQAAGIQLMREMLKSLSSSHLQAICRRAKMRDLYRKDLSARTIQAFVQRRQVVQAKMESQLALTSIARLVKSSLSNRQYARQRQASLALQAALRMKLGQQSGRERMCKNSAAFSLQAAMRCQLASRDRMAKRYAIDCLQQFAKSAVARQKHAYLKASAIRLQAPARRYVAKRRNACVTLEPFFERMLSNRKHALTRHAAVMLQAALRRSKGQDQGKGYMEASRKSDSAQLIQGACRQSLAKEYHSRKVAVLTIQPALQRLRPGLKYKDKVCARTTLQRIVLSSLARSAFHEQIAAALLLQAACRAHGGCAQGQKKMEQCGCIFLQAACRQTMARKNYIRGLAAKVIQASLRRRLYHIAEQERKKRDEEKRQEQEAKEKERARKEEEDRKAAEEAERKRQGEEQAKREEDERKRLEEEQAKREEDERKRHEEEQAKREEGERKRQEEEQAKRDEDERKRQEEEQAKRDEDERLCREAEDLVCQEEEAKKKASETAAEQEIKETATLNAENEEGMNNEGRGCRNGEEGGHGSGAQDEQNSAGDGKCENGKADGDGESGVDEVDDVKRQKQNEKDRKQAEKEAKKKRKEEKKREKERERAEGHAAEEVGESEGGEEKGKEHRDQAQGHESGEERDDDQGQTVPQERQQEHERTREREKGKKPKGADWERVCFLVPCLSCMTCLPSLPLCLVLHAYVILWIGMIHAIHFCGKSQFFLILVTTSFICLIFNAKCAGHDATCRHV
jgi:tetratricopeptide (TPR) repeat protein